MRVVPLEIWLTSLVFKRKCLNENKRFFALSMIKLSVAGGSKWGTFLGFQIQA